MNDMPSELLGLDRIRARFLSMLAERQIHIAHHALAAWESDTAEAQRVNLQEAQHVLHQIAGSAGSLGFDALGQAARECEGAIINHVETIVSDDCELPHTILEQLDTFVSMSQDLISKNS